jgi:hypothetical protein
VCVKCFILVDIFGSSLFLVEYASARNTSLRMQLGAICARSYKHAAPMELETVVVFWFYKHGGPNGPWALALNCFDGRDGFVRLEDARNLGMEKV